ncbi:MAG: hypothetical protein QM747_17145 [Nocardioides sp.]
MLDDVGGSLSSRKPKPEEPRKRVPTERLQQALRIRYDFLKRSCESYDAGNQDEALRMSVDLRALFYHGSSKPLLAELGVIWEIRYASSVPERLPGTERIWGGGLTSVAATITEGEVSGAIAPRGDDATLRFVDYAEWWRHERVVTGEDGRTFSRMFLVQQMANHEGAHTDPYLNGDYDSLGPQLTTWSVTANDVHLQIAGDVGKASMRQIAWEATATLERELGSWL